MSVVAQPLSNKMIHIGGIRLILRLIISYTQLYAGVAQLVERLICNQRVVGSNPIASFLHTNPIRFKYNPRI